MILCAWHRLWTDYKQTGSNPEYFLSSAIDLAPNAQTKEDPVWLTEKGSHFATHEAPEMKETEVRLTVSPRASDSLGCVGMYPDVGLSKSFFGDNLCRESSGRRYTTLHGYI